MDCQMSIDYDRPWGTTVLYDTTAMFSFFRTGILYVKNLLHENGNIKTLDIFTTVIYFKNKFNCSCEYNTNILC